MANYQFKLTGDEIAKRLDKVTTLESSVSTMGSELQTVADEVDKHDSRLDTAEAAIKADEEKLESTINDVATNAKGIAENKTAIGTNATNIATNTANIATNTEAIAALEEKTPTMWANVLAVKDTAITVDGQRVELPAYTNVVIKDFKTMSVVRTDSPHPKCIKRFDIHYNGATSIKQLQFGAYYKASDQTYQNYIGMSGVSDLDLSGIKFDGTNMSSAFCCVGAGTLDLKGWNAKPTNIYRLFYGANKVTSLDLAGWDVSAVTDFMWAFKMCSSLTELDVSTWNVSKGTSFYGTFEGCAKLKSLDLSGWETSNCGNYASMFSACSTLEALNISKLDMTRLNNTTNMFYGCYMLTDITFGEGFGKAKASGLTLDLSTCGGSKSYQLTDNTYNTMLTMYDRATNGLPTMTIKFNAKHNLPDGFIAAMTARGYVISQ